MQNPNQGIFIEVSTFSCKEKKGLVRCIVQVCNFVLQKSVSTDNVAGTVMQLTSRQTKYGTEYKIMAFLPCCAFI